MSRPPPVFDLLSAAAAPPPDAAQRLRLLAARTSLDLSAFCDWAMATPPEGQTSNLVNPASQANLPRIFTYITLPPMVVFLALRFYTRAVVTRQVGVDDYLCLLSAAALIAQVGVMFTILDSPAGPHDWDVRLCDITDNYPRSSILESILFPVAAMFVKMAVLALYKRIFGPVRLANVLIWSGLVFTLLFYMSLIIAFAATSIPRAEDAATGFWLSLQYDDRANRWANPLAAACGIVGALLDVYILVVPLYFVWNLRMSYRNKAGVAAIFFTGVLATAFSIAGAYYRYLLVQKPGFDLSWRAMPVYAMNVAEINVAIICSCMPVIFVLFKGLMEKSASWVSKLWSSRFGHSRHGRGGDPKSSQFDPSTGATSQSGSPPYKREGGGGLLPQVPRGALTGLRSFVRNVGRSRPLPATTMRTGTNNNHDDDVMLTMVSAEYDYHGHIRNNSSSAHVARPSTTTIFHDKSGSQATTTTTTARWGVTGPEQQGPQDQTQARPPNWGHFREGFQGPVPTDLHNQFAEEEHNTHDFLGQLRKTSTIGQAQ